jgi:transposase
MEISSNYWENMCSYLKEMDISSILLNPYQVKKYRQAVGKKIKTDSIDAEAIAGLISGRKYESLYISETIQYWNLGSLLGLNIASREG